MWSNDGHACLNSLTLPTLPKATFTATAGTGLAMNFNATGSGPSIADFSWQFNDSTPGCTATCNNTIETTVPTISHTFPAAGDYSVGLAVFQSSGTSIGVGGIIATGHSGFVPGFTDSISGLKASFKGLTNISEQAVTGYLWEFGDGTVRHRRRALAHLREGRQLQGHGRGVQRHRIGVSRLRGRADLRQDDHRHLTLRLAG